MAGSSPSIVTSGADDNSQAMLMQAILANMNPQQAAPIQAALALQAKRMANKRYMRDTVRKSGTALTNGASTQAYTLASPLTFNLNTALNGYVEGIIIRAIVNYTLATGTGATYALTPTGKFGLIDTIEVRYNKSQIKMRPKYLRDIALMGGLDQSTLPDQVLFGNGQQDTYVQNWVNTSMPVAAGAQVVTQEFFLPFNLISPEDPRGILPLMAGDTGIQVIINTPQGILGPDALLNGIYASGGTGNAISAISGTLQVEAVYRDGDTYNSTNKMPFDISVLEGTLQMQLDQPLNPLIANAPQRTKLNVMGYHYYVILTVIDNIQSSSYATSSNITYIESAKDGIGGNTFWKYGTQTFLDYRDWLAMNRWIFHQDLDQGVVPMIAAPLRHIPDTSLRNGRAYLDNTRTGWADWRYAVQVAATGAVSSSGPRIEPFVVYVNPTGLVPV